VSRPKPKRRAKPKPWPRCEKCGCTEDRACEGGCAWDPIAWLNGRYICTRCTGRYQLAEL